MTETRAPIFVIGRQHCGNTMLSTMLGRHPEVYAFTGEGNFFEHIDSIQAETHEECRKRVVDEITHGSGGLGDDQQEALRAHLREETERQGAVGLYTEGKAALTRWNRADRWAQKATSYVFHVKRILETFPDARLLFLVRNPLDLAASVQRRGYFESHIARTIWGWNTGVRRALDYSDIYTSSLQILQYEDLVRYPEEEMREILDFCGLPFSTDCLDIPHVNPSENPYSETANASGANTSRVFYYPDVLTVRDETAIRTLVDDDLLKSLYPNLPSQRGAQGWKQATRAGVLVATSMLATTRQHARMLLKNPAHTLRRLKERLIGS